MFSRKAVTKSFVTRRVLTAASPATANGNKIRLLSASTSTTGFPPPVLFDYETIKKNLTVADAISSVEEAFGALAKGKVDVPMPMHIGIEESASAGPGDCHIKGGYVYGAKTFTVKLACVSFYKNVTERNLPAGSGVFVVVDAQTGAPVAFFQENRIMTDLRTGAAGAVAIKYTTPDDDSNVIGFIGTGAIARNMARAAAAVRPNFTGVAYGLDVEGAETFAKDMSEELGLNFFVASSSEELCGQSNVIFTQTTGSEHVLKLEHLQKGTTIIASGSDQPTKQEIPNEVLASADKYIADLIKQTSRVGELRGAIEAKVMTTEDVYAELGELVNGTKAGRENNKELIVVDLTGTGAQDAAIGQVGWEKLSQLST
mmetsp:Transcript_11977/g.25365  ORF Transcript_11977/g.25365 Transcript_11977/m.25365 type:complete len:372 (-) Transcript_11977:221-1336(-)